MNRSPISLYGPCGSAAWLGTARVCYLPSGLSRLAAQEETRLAALQLVPVVLSLLVLGAHFLRAGNVSAVVVVLVLLGLLAVRRPWAARAVQIGLALGAVEWVWTLWRLVDARMAAGEPAVRMAAILGAVTLVTGLSALIFQTQTLRQIYRLERRRPVPGASPDGT